MKPAARLLNTVALALAVGACGARSAKGGDGGPDGSVGPETQVGGRRSFDVVAALGGPNGGAIKGGPSTISFTLFLDGEGTAVVGGKGVAAAVPYTTVGGKVRLPAFSVGVIANACEGVSRINFLTFEVTAGAASLAGKASGMANVSCGDCFFAVPFMGDVSGAPDVSAPTLLPSGGLPLNPFESFSLVASEPLPGTATARLVGSDGSHLDLVPTRVEGTVPLVTAFSKPEVGLPYDVGFAVELSGLVDFAGHQGSTDTQLRLTGFTQPPLLPFDGFESVTGAQVGGATVIADGPLPPITGLRSVYIGRAGAQKLGDHAPGAFLRVRLAVPTGATQLRFSFRIVSNFGGGAPAGTIELGSVGHMGALAFLTADAPGEPTPWPDGTMVDVTPVTTKRIPLPADVTDEVSVAFEANSGGCGGLLAPVGALIDDLRVE